MWRWNCTVTEHMKVFISAAQPSTYGPQAKILECAPAIQSTEGCNRDQPRQIGPSARQQRTGRSTAILASSCTTFSSESTIPRLAPQRQNSRTAVIEFDTVLREVRAGSKGEREVMRFDGARHCPRVVSDRKPPHARNCPRTPANRRSPVPSCSNPCPLCS